MKEYLNHTFNPDDPGLILVQDELPFWSAPFGLKLLDVIKMRKNINVLDIGSGFGFPLIEIAQRLGTSCRVYGIDPWKPAIERIRFKIDQLKLTNVEIIEGFAEQIPFENNFFDLIISNNGINNVEDMNEVFRECFRVCRKDARFIFTLNMEETMLEFYSVFESVLLKHNLNESAKKIKEHIYKKRRPLEEISGLLCSAGFRVERILRDEFHYRFSDAEAMFNYSMIKYWFLPSWKELVPKEHLQEVFEMIEEDLNKAAIYKGEIKLTIPFALYDCGK